MRLFKSQLPPDLQHLFSEREFYKDGERFVRLTLRNGEAIDAYTNTRLNGEWVEVTTLLPSNDGGESRPCRFRDVRLSEIVTAESMKEQRESRSGLSLVMKP